MNKIVVGLLSLILVSSIGCTQKGHRIEGDLIGAEDGMKITLKPFALYDVKAESETIIKDGHFVFDINVPEPRMYYLVLGDELAYYKIMVEDSDIAVKGKIEKREGAEPDSFNYTFHDMEVSGSNSNIYFYEQMKVKDRLNLLYQEKNELYSDLQSEIGTARMSLNQSMMDSLQQLDRYKAFEAAEKSFFDEVKKSYAQVLTINKDTYWGPLMMLNLFSYLTPENRTDFEAMSDEAKNSYYGKMVAEDLYPANKEGETIPEFKIKKEDGSVITLAELSEGKKVILIDFWASWCNPCRKEIPNLKANYDMFANKGFEIVSFSIDRSEKAWLKALEEEGLKWPNFRDLEVSSLFKVKAVPTMYLVNENGILLGENLRGEALTEKLTELLGQ